jgi:hypothetical protein
MQAANASGVIFLKRYIFPGIRHFSNQAVSLISLFAVTLADPELPD